MPGSSWEVKFLWLWHLLALIALVLFLKDLKLPDVFESDAFTSKPNKLSDTVAVGLWRGGLIHIAISSLVLLTVRWWDRAQVATLPTRFHSPKTRPIWFWPILGIILLTALFLRWPRMDDSFWGDEGQALRFFGYGKHLPLNGDDMQGPLKFEPVSWKHAVWDDQTGGNHYLFSIIDKLTLDAWRAFNGLPDDALSEAVSRFPLLTVGLASIAASALFLSWLGRPGAGLFTALYLAIHPWHIRYSTEARGYVLMLFFFLLAIWALLHALRTGTWKAWILFALAELLSIYSWKVAILPFALINGSLILWMLFSRKNGSLSARLSTITRLLVVNLTAGAIFAFLVMPCTLQSPRALQHIKGKPMDEKWLGNTICGILTGSRWYRDASDNPTEQPLSEAIASAPLRFGFGIASALALLGSGIWVLVRTRPEQAFMWCLVLVSAGLGMCLFKWVLHIEWIYWYSFFTILPLSVFTGLGLASWAEHTSQLWHRAQNPQSKGLAIAFALFVFCAPLASLAVSVPQIQLMETQPCEPYREVFQLTRGRHEPLGFSGPSNVITCYLWRHMESYDPRADWHVRDAKRLAERMAEADSMNGHLYFIVSQRDLFKDMNRDLKNLLDDPQLFETIAILWAQEDIHTKAIYHYLGASKGSMP